jgi:23S rRNA (uracil1939-C5)-methyltransferase
VPAFEGRAQLVYLERAVPGGDSIGRLADGQWVFVTGAVVGDTISIQRVERRRGVARAVEWTVSTPSSARREPPCPVARQCGGCDWMAHDDAAQAENKLALVRDALRRVGGIEDLPHPPLQLVRAGSTVGYRSRARLQIAQDGCLGFLARASHDQVAIERCWVCSPRWNLELKRLALHFSAEEPNSEAACGAFAQLELRALADLSEVRLFPRNPKARWAPSGELRAWLRRLREHFDVSVQGVSEVSGVAQAVRLFAPEEALAADSELNAALGEPCSALVKDLTLQVGDGVFTQVNWAINAAIVTELLGGARLRKSRRFVDLYCGVGNFSLPLLALGLTGLGIEQNERAIQLARAAAEAQGLGGEFVTGAVLHRARALRQSGTTFDLVVLDPARDGAGPALPEIAALAERDLFYCACDPVSLARDLRWLTHNGFELTHVRAYDMFPQTHHVETTAWLTRVSK